jgi:hypothetical protein
MIAHGISDDVCHLVKLAVVHLEQGMEYAALNRLQPVVDVRDRTILDDVGGILEEVLIE